MEILQLLLNNLLTQQQALSFTRGFLILYNMEVIKRFYSHAEGKKYYKGDDYKGKDFEGIEDYVKVPKKAKKVTKEDKRLLVTKENKLETK